VVCVCIGGGVEKRFMVVHERANGQFGNYKVQ
jgi:hypothetical protein